MQLDSMLYTPHQNGIANLTIKYSVEIISCTETKTAFKYHRNSNYIYILLIYIYFYLFRSVQFSALLLPTFSYLYLSFPLHFFCTLHGKWCIFWMFRMVWWIASETVYCTAWNTIYSNIDFYATGISFERIKHDGWLDCKCLQI